MAHDARQALLDAAAAVFSADPSASLAEVAAKAGLGRATLHRHFRTRQALIDALARASLEAAKAADQAIESAPTARQALRILFETMMPLGARYHFLTLERVDDPKIERERQRQLAELSEVIEWARNEGDIAADVPVEWVVTVIEGLIFSGWSAIESGQVAPRQAAKLALRTLLDGLGPTGGKRNAG